MLSETKRGAISSLEIYLLRTASHSASQIGRLNPIARKTHHKHSSSKDYRRLLDRLAAHPDVHRVATGKVKPRMGSGRPVAIISKTRKVDSGLSITINIDGAVIDAYVITSEPERVVEYMHGEGWLG